MIRLVLLAVVLDGVASIFCDSACADSFSTCGGSLAFSGCTSCAITIYTGTAPCTLKPQLTQIAYELDPTNMNLANFITSNSTIRLCGGYNISGQYIFNDYIQRTYSSLGVNHYQITVRFSLAFIGTAWAGTEKYLLTAKDGSGTAIYANNFTYACSNLQFLCNTAATATDCFFNYEADIFHNSNTITLLFSASTSQANPLVQFWGVKSLHVVAMMCFSACATCTGPASSNCVTCVSGLYLIGSICVSACPQLTIPSLGLCTTTCPQGYFLNSLNNFCEACSNGCAYCSSVSNCISWATSADNPQNVFYDNLEVWILLLAGVLALIGFVIWKYLCAEKSAQERINQDALDKRRVVPEKANQSNDFMLNTHYVEDIDEVSPVKLGKKKQKKRNQIGGIGRLDDLKY